MTSCPSACNGGITLLKHEPSAQMPWQNTIVGLGPDGMSPSPLMRAPGKSRFNRRPRPCEFPLCLEGIASLAPAEVDPTTALTQRKEHPQSGPKRMWASSPPTVSAGCAAVTYNHALPKASLACWKPTLRSLSLLRCYLELPPVKYTIPKNRGKADCHND